MPVLLLSFAFNIRSRLAVPLTKQKPQSINRTLLLEAPKSLGLGQPTGAGAFFFRQSIDKHEFAGVQ